VVFECLAPAAHIVYLAGDFNDWGRNRDGLVFDPQFSMMLSGEVWCAEIPLPPGRHAYQFVLDGDRWLADPTNPTMDDAGHSVIEVK
jgi:1,4-alpha-glucan branching enzyme